MTEPKKGQDDAGTETRKDERERRERTAAPPLEREHETQEGALEEDESREPPRR
jgi:hypothetical protein